MDPNPIGFAKHDHSHCVEDAVAVADKKCRDAGLQLTPVRQRALEILLEEHRAFGAYEILERLSQDGFGAQPPVAYRALDFLTRHGLAHKIERINAFIACAHPGDHHTPAFLICTTCHVVAEAETDPGHGLLDQIAQTTGFQVSRAVLEAEGTCPNCALKSDAAQTS